MDGIPLLSQGKSLIQLVCFQPKRAWETQKNFSRQCPVVSQVRSVVEAVILDDEKAAVETQKECGRFVGGLVNAIPVVGHAKGLIHYACGDSEGGDSAMKASSHSAAVTAGGVAGFFVGGPAGAAALGIAAGAAMDATITIADTEINGMVDGKVRTFGIYEPLNDPTDVGKWVDAGCGAFLDGVAARGAGKIAGKVAHNIKMTGRSAFAVVEESVNESSSHRTTFVEESINERSGGSAPTFVEESINERSGHRTTFVEESINERSGGNATTFVEESRLDRTAWPSELPLQPNTTVLVMVQKECLHFCVAKLIGKAEVVILQDLLTDVGPMVLSFIGRRLLIACRNHEWYFQDGSSDDLIVELLFRTLHAVRDEDSEGMNRWKRFWNNPKRVAMLRYFLERVRSRS